MTSMMSCGVSSDGGVQLRREFDPHLPGVLDEAGSGVLAQVAEGLAQGLVVNRPCRDGLGRDGGPCLRVARVLAGEMWSKVRAAASRWVNAAPRSQVLRSAAISEACRYSWLYTEPGSTQGRVGRFLNARGRSALPPIAHQ